MKFTTLLALIFVAGLTIGALAGRWEPQQAARAGQMQMQPAHSMKASRADEALQEAMMRMHSDMTHHVMTGDADRDFVTLMIPHHRSAVDMARAELRYGRRPAVKSLARRILAAQTQEISLMGGWLRDWNRQR